MAKKDEKNAATPTSSPSESLPTKATPVDIQKWQQRPEGTEDIDRKSDIILPRLAIAQALSPELKAEDPKFIEGLKQGEMFNTVTGQIYGKGPIEISIVLYLGVRGVQFRPRSEGGGVIDMNVPLDDPRMQFTIHPETRKSVPPVATKFIEYMVMIVPKTEEEQPQLVVLSVKSAMLKVGRLLNSFLTQRVPPIPIYQGRYSLHVTTEKKPKGEFFTFVVRNLGKSEESSTLFQMAQAFHRSFKEQKAQIRVDEYSDDDRMDPDHPDAEREM